MKVHTFAAPVDPRASHSSLVHSLFTSCLSPYPIAVAYSSALCLILMGVAAGYQEWIYSGLEFNFNAVAPEARVSVMSDGQLVTGGAPFASLGAPHMLGDTVQAWFTLGLTRAYFESEWRHTPGSSVFNLCSPLATHTQATAPKFSSPHSSPPSPLPAGSYSFRYTNESSYQITEYDVLAYVRNINGGISSPFSIWNGGERGAEGHLTRDWLQIEFWERTPP